MPDIPDLADETIRVPELSKTGDNGADSSGTKRISPAIIGMCLLGVAIAIMGYLFVVRFF